MNEHRIATIALSNRDFPSLEAKLDEAAQWIALAAGQGAKLAVLPEALNYYKGDGDGNADRPRLEDVAMDDWRDSATALIDAARSHRIAVTVPVLTREHDPDTGESFHANSFFLVDQSGQTRGRYQKIRPTPEELDMDVRPGPADPELIEWEGLKIGGAICFDTNFPEVFEAQAAAGADLFLAPSLWPGGQQLEYFARLFSTPIVLAYPAWSRIIGIDGRDLAAGGYRHETLRFGFGSPVYVADVNFDRAAFYGNDSQQKMVEIQRVYGEAVRISFEQADCTFYIESRSPELTMDQVIERFSLVRSADYFARCRRQCGREPVPA